MKRFVAVLMACLMLFSITGFALAEELSITVDFVATMWEDPEDLSISTFLEGVELFIIRDGIIVSTIFTNLGGHANYVVAISGTYEVEIRVPDGHALQVWSHDERSEADGIVSIYPRSTRFSLGEFSPDTRYSSMIVSLSFVESNEGTSPSEQDSDAIAQPTADDRPIPATEDETNMGLWIVLMIIALLGLVVSLVIVSKKRRK